MCQSCASRDFAAWVANRWVVSEGIYGPKVSKMLWMENAIFMEKKIPSINLFYDLYLLYNLEMF